MRRLLLLSLIAASCVSGEGQPLSGRQRGPGAPPEGAKASIAVVITHGDEPTAGTFFNGIRLGVRDANRSGDAARRRVGIELFQGAASIPDALASSVATLVVGPGSDVAAARAEIERDGDPVFLLAGDLYSTRELFRQVFQVSPPLAWQAEPLARYLVHDRGAREIVLVTEVGTDEERARVVFDAAVREEGSRLATSRSFASENVDLYDVSPAFGADAVALFGGRDVATLAAPLARSASEPVVAFFADGLAARLPAGTVASYPYTWAGWAEPIARVRRFRERFERAFGQPPAGFEQEGYDAVRLLADALGRTGGRGGPALVAALENTTDATYSALPISLGPDDHLLTSRGQIGIFVRLAPGERSERITPTGIPWAPLMRTFTYNGLRTSIIDEDKRVFFPAWRKKAPPPAYPRSRYGITTGRDDPRH